MYDSLQRICKAERLNEGGIPGKRKKVMLISATPLNNRPDDLYNLLLLFQDKRNCTIDGVPNLHEDFSRWIKEYKLIMSPRNETIDVKAVDRLYNEIRNKVIDKVTVRRTRNNIKNDEEYQADLDKQKIKFPDIEKPRQVEYVLPPDLKKLFEDTMRILTEELKYSRYRAIEALVPDLKQRYPGAEQTSQSLASIYRTHMVKRLESSFFALRKSLRNLRNATQGMIDMFAADKVVILPELKVKDLQAQDVDIEDIIEKGIEKFGVSRDSFVYKSADFQPEFLENLKYDVALLDNLSMRWTLIKDQDPKIEEFVKLLQGEIFDKKLNPTDKLVVFSESKDTIAYLLEQLQKRLERNDILAVSSADRKKLFEDIQANFDANYKTQKDKYNIIVSTDVLAEGVNLHRANIIVNYDTPWNASRLMQRIGRVNRIGSVAGLIVNYMFYPSAEGDAQIRLYKNALVKLQGFHSAFGEDSQIYSREEIVGQFELFNKDIDDNIDHTLTLQREVRDLFTNDPEKYQHIKYLPYKSRTARTLADSKTSLPAKTSLAYIASSFKKEFYLIKGNDVTDLGFLEAAEYFRATPEEPGYAVPDEHYAQVSKAAAKFDTDVTKMLDDNMKASVGNDKNTGLIIKMLGELSRRAEGNFAENIEILRKYVEHGTYQRLTRDLLRLVKQRKKDKEDEIDYEGIIRQFVRKYHRAKPVSIKEEEEITPRIIISESFIDKVK